MYKLYNKLYTCLPPQRDPFSDCEEQNLSQVAVHNGILQEAVDHNKTRTSESSLNKPTHGAKTYPTHMSEGKQHGSATNPNSLPKPTPHLHSTQSNPNTSSRAQTFGSVGRQPPNGKSHSAGPRDRSRTFVQYSHMDGNMNVPSEQLHRNPTRIDINDIVERMDPAVVPSRGLMGNKWTAVHDEQEVVATTECWTGDQNIDGNIEVNMVENYVRLCN